MQLSRSKDRIVRSWWDEHGCVVEEKTRIEVGRNKWHSDRVYLTLIELKNLAGERGTPEGEKRT